MAPFSLASRHVVGISKFIYRGAPIAQKSPSTIVEPPPASQPANQATSTISHFIYTAAVANVYTGLSFHTISWLRRRHPQYKLPSRQIFPGGFKKFIKIYGQAGRKQSRYGTGTIISIHYCPTMALQRSCRAVMVAI